MPSSTADRTKEQGQASAHPWLSSYPKGVVWHQHFAAKPLYSLLDDAVSRYPNKPCTNFLGKVLTYSEIGHQVDRAAAGLQRLGVAKGTKVGLFLPNSPTYIVFYFAVLKIGAIVVNFNPLYTVEELSFQVRDSETDLMITLDLKVLFDKVEALLSSGVLNRAVVCSFAALLPVAKSVLFRLLKGRDLAQIDRSPVARQIIPGARVMANDGVYSRPNLDPENDIAVLQYTGGTTGTPKGAMLTHANLYINVMQVVAWAPGLEEGRERVMGVLPFFHVFAMTVVMNFGIARAAELVIMPRFVLADALKLITETRPTVMPGVPTLFNAMLNHPQLRSYDLSSLRFCLSGGAPLPVEVKHKFEALTGCKLVEGYGLSETSPVVTANPLEGPVKAGSIGQPLPGTLVSLRDLADPAKEVPQGERGELCVSGPQVMKGYWNRPEETAAQFVGSFIRTGDVAVMDEDGFFYIVDRLKDLIISSGFNVYPRRVEEAIYTHPAVEEVTVIGIPDEYRGEAPKAFIKLKKGMEATKEDILRHLAPKLSRIEQPSEIEFREELPKTMIGKLSKKELRQEELQKRKAVH
jgi:long-chain acyl-CoA synthetase